MDGVLKSWAVTKGPSLVPGEKRLAVHVEDHPLDYGSFEGTIPKGEYGGGTVILWDRGTWSPIGDAHRGYRKGHLDFELQGEKLGGRWHLVRMAGKPREKRENWLLIKGDDQAARSEGDPDILDERPESVATGREIQDVAGEEPGWSSKTGRIRKKGGTRANRVSPSGKLTPGSSRPVKDKRSQKGCPAGVHRANAGDTRCVGSCWPALAARDQVRRLPFPGAPRRRPGEAPDAQRPRLDQEVRQAGGDRICRTSRQEKPSSMASLWSRRVSAPPIFPHCRRI